MAANWKSIIDNLQGQITQQAKNDAKNFVDQLLTDGNAFAQRQGKKITAYLSEYAAGEMTKQELEESVRDVQRLLNIQANEESAQAKQKLQGFGTQVGTILLQAVIMAII